MTVGIVDIGAANLGSLRQAIFNNGWDSVMVGSPMDLKGLTHLIVPGVGAFAASMKHLRYSRLIEPIQEFAADGQPILGICIGMQVLADTGMEGGLTDGLGLIPGSVQLIKADPGVRLPHVGWNEAKWRLEHPLLSGIRRDVDFYFVHGYRFVARDSDTILAETTHGETFPSIIARNNIVGVQFHPEKSQANGLRLIDNFCSWDGSC